MTSTSNPYRPPRPLGDDYCKPGALKKSLHARGEAYIYASADRKHIVIEHPDGSVERRPLPAEPKYELPVPLEIGDSGSQTATTEPSVPQRATRNRILVHK